MSVRQATMSLICFVLLFCLVGFSHGEDAAVAQAPAQPQQPTVQQAAKDMGEAAQNGAQQVIEKNVATLQEAGAAAGQIAGQQRNLLKTAFTGGAKFAKEVTGHTGGLFKGLASTVGQFGSGIISSGKSLIGRGTDPAGRPEVVQPAQAGASATPVVEAAKPKDVEASAAEVKPEEAKTEVANTEPAKQEEAAAEKAESSDKAEQKADEKGGEKKEEQKSEEKAEEKKEENKADETKQ